MTLNKKLLQFAAAMWILVFHLWMPLTSSGAEQFIIRIGYVGVDLFFFLAAYSLADKKLEYADFLKDRFFKVYVKFILFVIAAVMYKHWSLLRGLQILTGIEFFRRGGGSFLWFIPAIMIFYVLYPLFLKINSRYKSLIVLAGWFILSLISERCFGYTKVFIFTNRIPVILAAYELKHHKPARWLAPVCTVVGIAVLYLWGYKPGINVPLKDFYYVLAVLLVVGLAGMSAWIRSTDLIALLGSATIEMYAVQMIYGPDLVNRIYKLTSSKALTNVLAFAGIFAVSLAASKAYSLVYKLAEKRFKR